MRQLLILICSVLLFISCDEDKGYFISGKIDDAQASKVYISELSDLQRPERIDSTEIEDGEFELDMENPEYPNLHFLKIEGIDGDILFISENRKIYFDVNQDSLRASKVTGGKENRLLYQYLDHLKEVNSRVTEVRNDMRTAMTSKDPNQMETLKQAEEEIMDNDKVFKKKLISENPDAFVSLLALADITNMGLYPAKEVKEMYESLSDEVKQSPFAQKLEEALAQQSTVDIGSEAPDFSGPNPEGKEVSLADAKGKVTIIDFWAAWCKPCRVENPNVVKIYNKYHDRGLNIIGVSLDRPGQKDRWEQAIEDDGLEWYHVSNLKFWQEPIAALYGVKAIPATFILDENGVIVAKDLRGQELENKIQELLQN